MNNAFHRNPLSAAVRSASLAGLAMAAAAAAAPAFAAESGATDALEEVVVTGTRIQRSGFETSTPVNVVGEEAIADSGYANVYDVLKSVPSIGVGLGGSNSSPGGLSNAQAGAAFINLRGLGTDRSLVLVDGRRRVSGSSDSSAVDVSMIPAGMIERVEIITGGASAVYGADAVSGVVNMIMKDDIDGLELSVGTGASTEGSGGERVSLDLAGGADFEGGRGSLVFGVSYSKEEELRSQQRDFASTQLNLRPNPANTGPNDGIPDNIHVDDLGIFAFPSTGAFAVGGQWYTLDPDLRLLDRGIPFDAVRGIGAEGFRQVDVSRLRQEQEIFATRVSFNYDISNDVNFFVDADYGRTETIGSGQPDNSTQGDGFVINRLYRENPLLPADLAALMDANGLDSIAFSGVHTNWGLRTPIFDRTSYAIVAGFEGVLNNGWSWDVALQESRYENNSKWTNYSITEHVANAIDVIEDPVTGEPVCRSGAEGCVPFLPVGPEAPSAEALSYLQHTVLRFHRNEQRTATATLAGDVVELPAGPLQFATGLEYREESIKTLDDGLARQGGIHLFRGAEPQDADMSVNEAFLELVVPVFSGAPFAEQVDIEAAVRTSDYDTIGRTTATKLGLNWALSEDVRVRISSATSVRAPNLSELFSPGVTSGAFLTDPCDQSQIDLGTEFRSANCAALGIPAGWADPNATPAKEVVTGGNENLSEEESDSFTFGVVYTPAAVDRLNVSLDYWEIEIEDAIGTFEVAEIIEKCVDSPSINNNFCSLVTRDSQLSIARVDVNKINVGKLTASGLDFSAQYGFGVLDGDLAISWNGSYLFEHEELLDKEDSGSLFITRGNPDNPRFRSTLNLSYNEGPLTVALNTRYIGSALLDPNALTSESIDKNRVPARIYNDLIVNYEFDNELALTATITNLGDIDPPRRDVVFTGAQGSYDNVGRFVSLRASYKF